MASQPPHTPVQPRQGARSGAAPAQHQYRTQTLPQTPLAGAGLPSARSTPSANALPATGLSCICPSCGTHILLPPPPVTSYFEYVEQDAPPSSSKRKYSQRRSPKEKIFTVMSLLMQLGLTLGSFLVAIFTPGFFAFAAAGTLDGARSCGQMVSSFLRGRSVHGVSAVLALWLKHPMGLPKKHDSERDRLFSLAVPWAELRHARVALTSWAAQACARALERETRRVIRPEYGLHALIRTPRRGAVPASTGNLSATRALVRWSDIGAKTITEAQQTFETTTPLLWGLLRQVTEKKRVSSDPSITERRPWFIVVTGAIGQLLFTRRRTVNLLALQRSLTLFATRASTFAYRIESRFGATTSYNSVLDSLRTAGNERIAAAREIVRSAVRWFKFVFDNVQRYNRQWDMRAGRENAMLKGTAGTLFEMIGFDPSAFDLDEKQRLIAAGRRFDVTAADLRRLLDQKHLHWINALHWLQVLVNYVPELFCHRTAVAELFRRAAKEPTRPAGRTNIISLRSNAADPQYTTGIRNAIDDFLETQLGESKDSWNRRVVVVGGDGATFEGILRLKKERQNHDDEYDRYEHIEPELQLWHTKWTELSRIYAAHCGPADSKDPSTLRASIGLINRKVPADLKKVEFSSSLDMLMLIGEARMLDCWRVILETYDLLDYFQGKALQNALPTLEDLVELANKLDYMYTSPRAQDTATKERSRQPAAHRAPEDAEWLRKKTNEEIGEGDDFCGDRVLANATGLLTDFVHLREWCHATADGEVGRVYETLKIILFKFAGSGHNPRYLAYLLETFLSLEFECTESLKLARLINWLVNPTGLPGHNVEGDLVQEHHIKPLTAHSRRANAAYDGDFERNVLSPNLDNLVTLSRRMEEAVGLKARSSTHTALHTNPEMRKLLYFYRRKELHRFRAGRSYGLTAPSHYAIGMDLMPAKLRKFLETCRAENDVFGRMWSSPGSAVGTDTDTQVDPNQADPDVILPEHDPDEDPGIVIRDEGHVIAVLTEDDLDVEAATGDGELDEGDEELDELDGDGDGDEAEDTRDLDELWESDHGGEEDYDAGDSDAQ